MRRAPTRARSSHRVFVAASGGVGFANVKDPQIATPHIVGPVLGARLGVVVSPSWTISLAYTDFVRGITRAMDGEQFAAASQWLRTQSDCNGCHPPAPGGFVSSAVLRLDTLGPGVDFTPFGRNGLFVGVSGGLAFVSTFQPIVVGGGGVARGGFRLHLADVFSVALEGGVEGEWFSGASAVIPYGGAEVRLHL